MIKSIIQACSGIILSVFRRVIPFLYHCIIIGTILGIGASFLSLMYLNSNGPLSREANVIIPSGASTKSIAHQLGDAGVIESPEIFALLARILPYSNNLKAGEYSFNVGTTPFEALRKIHSGKVVVRNITIAEGLFTFQVLDLIKNIPVLTGDVPEGIKDGELLPQTYDYYYGESRAAVVKRMRDAMQKTIDELWEGRQENLPIKTKEQALILASIIEKETGVAEERFRVAGVFVNRLRKGMRLQTDPTVIYAVTKGKKLLGRPLTHKDLALESPYNTYRNAGLPPSPIANPGRASVEAALNPMATDDIYFVANGDGGHAFAKTLKQHNRNVSKWRKIVRQAKKNK